MSILLAFAIQAWWEGRGDRELERSYLTRLHAELLAGRALLATHHARQVRAVSAMDTLLEAFETPNASPADIMPQTLLNGGSYELDGRSTLFDQTYTEMLATGGLALVRDEGLREAITGYYQVAYQLLALVQEASDAGYREWGNRIRAAMGTQPRSWFAAEPQLGQGFALARTPSLLQAQRLIALLQPDTGWEDEVRYTKTRVQSVELNLRELAAQSDALLQTLASLPQVQASTSQ